MMCKKGQTTETGGSVENGELLTDCYWLLEKPMWSGSQHRGGAGAQVRRISLDVLADVSTDDNGWLAAQLGRALREASGGV